MTLKANCFSRNWIHLLLLVTVPLIGYSCTRGVLYNGLSLKPLKSGVTIQAGHLWWKNETTGAKALYGRITVLASAPGVYYCGANWNPGQPAGGYAGIQHNTVTEKRTIFSVWDTDKATSQNTTSLANGPGVVVTFFTNDGSGTHTHKVINWAIGETIQFVVLKSPSTTTANTTNTEYYIFDNDSSTWLFMARLQSPNSGSLTVPVYDTLVSFLENFTNGPRDIPKVALYQLWTGETLSSLHFLRSGTGDPKGTEWNWGQMGDSYFLIEGQSDAVNTIIKDASSKYGIPVLPAENGKVPDLPNISLPSGVFDSLQTIH